MLAAGGSTLIETRRRRESRPLRAIASRPRLLACDIDGTLLDHGGLLRPHVRDAIRLVAESGVHVVLATGRSPWAGVAEIAHQLGLTGPQVTMQGALISVPSSGETHRLRALPEPTYLDALAFAAEQSIGPIVAVLNGHRAVADARWVDDARPAFAVGRAFRAVDDLASVLHEHPVRVFLPTDAERHVSIRSAMVDRFGAVASVIWSDWTGVEVLAHGTSKGEAVAWLAASLGLGLDEVAAVGDALNDIEMLGMAGWSAAMACAPAEVRDVADIVVPLSSEDGILAALAWFFPELAGELPAPLDGWGAARPVA